MSDYHAVDRQLAAVLNNLSTPQYERPAQVQAWLLRRAELLPLLHTAFTQHSPAFDANVLPLILDYCRPQHFHYTWQPLVEQVPRDSATALDRHASKFGGNHPFLLPGEESGARCTVCGDDDSMEFMFQLADDDLPDGVRGAYVPADMRADAEEGVMNSRGVRPRPMLQLWQCVGCMDGRGVAVKSGPRWIDTAAYDSSDYVLPDHVVGYTSFQYGRRSGTIHMLSGWSAPKTDRPCCDDNEPYVCINQKPRAASDDSSSDSGDEDDTADDEHEPLHTSDQLSGFGQWPNPLCIERCEICGSLYEPMFELGCEGSSVCERYTSWDDLFSVLVSAAQASHAHTAAGNVIDGGPYKIHRLLLFNALSCVIAVLLSTLNWKSTTKTIVLVCEQCSSATP